jgi:hypothetical protein
MDFGCGGGGGNMVNLCLGQDLEIYGVQHLGEAPEPTSGRSLARLSVKRTLECNGRTCPTAIATTGSVTSSLPTYTLILQQNVRPSSNFSDPYSRSRCRVNKNG